MWSTLQLTAGKSPLLAKSEQQVAVYEKVVLASRSREFLGWAYLTTHRLCFVDNGHPEENSGAIALDQIVSVDLVASLLKSPRIVVDARAKSTPKTRSWVCEICSFGNKLSVSEPPVCSNCGIVHEFGAQDAQEPSQSADGAQPVVPVEPALPVQPVAPHVCPQCTFENHPLLRECEICGFGLKKARENALFGPTVEMTFKEAKELYAKLKHQEAAEPQELSETPAQAQARGEPALPGIHRLNLRAAPTHTPTNPLSKLETNQLERMLEAYRRVSPTYYDLHTISGPIGATTPAQLARQLSIFLDENKLLESQGGLMSMHHLFAAFNRARYDTVSASSMVKALEIAPELGMPIRIRTLKNGTKLLGSNDWVSPQDRLINWLRSKSGETALAAATHFKWSLMIAREELEQAELEGLVCRDETKTSVLWWPQAFRQAARQAAG